VLGEPRACLAHELSFMNLTRSVIILLVSVLDLLLVKTFKFLLQHNFSKISVAGYDGVEFFIFVEFALDRLNRHFL